jgi:thioredoxin reductase (NADPH)
LDKATIPDNVYDIVIIGGGPAGLTAGIYASRASLRTLLIEGASSISQITVTDIIENYPGMPEGIGGFELVERFKKQALQFGLEIASEDVIGIAKTHWGNTEGWKVTSAGRDYEALAVIVATGAYWRKLGVRGEDVFVGKGVSYCATCDGPIYKLSFSPTSPGRSPLFIAATDCGRQRRLRRGPLPTAKLNSPGILWLRKYQEEMLSKR